MHAVFQVNTKLVSSCGGRLEGRNFSCGIAPEALNSPTFAGESRTELGIPLSPSASEVIPFLKS
jgi:hypothetical protein